MKSFELRRILVPTDLSEPAQNALRYAKLLAAAVNAHIDVVHVDPILPPRMFLEAGSSILDVVPEPSRGKALELRVHDSASSILGAETPFSIHIVEGAPIPMLVRTAEELEADLVVVGTRALRGWRRAAFASLTAELVHALDRPLLAVKLAEEPSSSRITKVLCPVNMTAVALDALRVAEWLASRLGAELNVVHEVEDERDADEPAHLRRWLDQNGFGALPCRDVVVRGDAGERVLNCAEDLGADLVVIGAEQRFFADETVVGTTTERLLRFASCPVLTVPRCTPTSASPD